MIDEKQAVGRKLGTLMFFVVRMVEVPFFSCMKIFYASLWNRTKLKIRIQKAFHYLETEFQCKSNI